MNTTSIGSAVTVEYITWFGICIVTIVFLYPYDISLYITLFHLVLLLLIDNKHNKKTTCYENDSNKNSTQTTTTTKNNKKLLVPNTNDKLWRYCNNDDINNDSNNDNNNNDDVRTKINSTYNGDQNGKSMSIVIVTILVVLLLSSSSSSSSSKQQQKQRQQQQQQQQQQELFLNENRYYNFQNITITIAIVTLILWRKKMYKNNRLVLFVLQQQHSIHWNILLLCMIIVCISLLFMCVHQQQYQLIVPVTTNTTILKTLSRNHSYNCYLSYCTSTNVLFLLIVQSLLVSLLSILLYVSIYTIQSFYTVFTKGEWITCICSIVFVLYECCIYIVQLLLHESDTNTNTNTVNTNESNIASIFGIFGCIIGCCTVDYVFTLFDRNTTKETVKTNSTCNRSKSTLPIATKTRIPDTDTIVNDSTGRIQSTTTPTTSTTTAKTATKRKKHRNSNNDAMTTSTGQSPYSSSTSSSDSTGGSLNSNNNNNRNKNKNRDSSSSNNSMAISYDNEEHDEITYNSITTGTSSDKSINSSNGNSKDKISIALVRFLYILGIALLFVEISFIYLLRNNDTTNILQQQQQQQQDDPNIQFPLHCLQWLIIHFLFQQSIVNESFFFTATPNNTIPYTQHEDDVQQTHSNRSITLISVHEQLLHLPRWIWLLYWCFIISLSILLTILISKTSNTTNAGIKSATSNRNIHSITLSKRNNNDNISCSSTGSKKEEEKQRRNLPTGTKNRQKVAIIVQRKLYHLIAVLLFTPSTIYSIQLQSLSYSIAVSLLCSIEMIRHYLPSSINIFYTYYLDTTNKKENTNTIIISHIGLVLGCAIPLWISQYYYYFNNNNNQHYQQQYYNNNNNNTDTISFYVILSLWGVICLGVGDAMGAVIGKLYGTRKWGQQSRTIEGSLAMFISMSFCCYTITIYTTTILANTTKSTLYDSNGNNSNCMIWLPAVTIVTILEAFTWQIDNFVLPLAGSIVLLLTHQIMVKYHFI